jgi:hypothetical protein
MDITIFTIPQYPPNFIPIGSVFVHRVNMIKTPTKGMFNYGGTAMIGAVNDLEKQIEVLRGELLNKLKQEAKKKDASVSALVDVKLHISVFGESSLLGQASATVLIKKTSGLNSQSARRNSPVAPLVQVPRPNSQVAPLASVEQPVVGSPVRPNIGPLGPPGPLGQLGGRKKYVSKLGKSRKNRL